MNPREAISPRGIIPPDPQDIAWANRQRGPLPNKPSRFAGIAATIGVPSLTLTLAACAPAAPPAEVRPAPQRPESQAPQVVGRAEPARAPERPVSREIAGWKDYSSPLGYSIKYPPAWQLVSSGAEDAYVDNSNPANVNAPVVRISPSSGASEQFDLEKQMKNAAELYRMQGYSTNFSSLVVGGVRAFRVSIHMKPGAHAVGQDTVSFIAKNTLWNIVLRTQPQDTDRARQVLDGMLASFRLN